MGNVTFENALNAGTSSVLAGFFFVISFSGLIFNSVLIMIIYLDRNLHTITNTFIVNLAVSDLITASAVVPFDADFLLRSYYPYGKILCGFKETMFMLSLPSSVVNLLLLTFERFVATKFPFKKFQYFTTNKVILLITLSWIYTLNSALFPIYYEGISAVTIKNRICYLTFPDSYAFYQIFGNFVVPVLIMVGIYIFLFSTVHKHKKQIRRNSIKTQLKCKTNHKTIKSIFLLVGNFLVCWLTFIVLATSNMICNGCHPRVITWLGNLVIYSNVFINPMLYGLMNKNIRKSLVKRIFIKFCIYPIQETKSRSNLFPFYATVRNKQTKNSKKHKLEIQNFTQNHKCNSTEITLLNYKLSDNSLL
ncbi:beta-2 adrenergic receptor-like [Hydra vulgaris]|uniref:Beta-2 adrenergic receptor-like n=1 Tax=Hydra vulgaris TaxID=6087 RepID=A0ABM4BWG9_HYDVU